jgi:hypothetical protein
MSGIRWGASKVLLILAGLNLLGILVQGLMIAHQQAGLIGVIVGFLVAPFLVLATPIYAGVALGSWRILKVDVVWLIITLLLAAVIAPGRDLKKDVKT